MRTKKQIEDRTAAALKKLRLDGTSYEEIAVKLGLSYNTIYNWASGRRSPKRPTLRQLESIYGIEIL